jgi:hypothetical protein
MKISTIQDKTFCVSSELQSELHFYCYTFPVWTTMGLGPDSHTTGNCVRMAPIYFRLFVSTAILQKIVFDE